MKSYIKSIGTAVPSHKNEQSKIVEFMSEAIDMNMKDKTDLIRLYRASGISYRYSVIPDFGLKKGDYKFFPNSKNLEPFPGVEERMKLYKKESLPLASKAVEECFQNLTHVKASDITHLITVSCTGMYAPGLDIELVSKFSMNHSVQRTAINFMGCYAAFNGLKLADAICKSHENAKVLLVCIELCTIHYQKSSHPDQLLSNALFSDGAAAVYIEGNKSNTKLCLSLENFHCDLAPEGKNDMAWNISNFGFEMTLSSYIPELIKNGIGKLTKNLLYNFSIESNDIDYYAIHPGGKKILEVVEDVLKIEKEKNRFAHHILREYGNMSSPTVLFVLKNILQNIENAHNKTILSFAFGPGLTLESLLLKVHQHPVDAVKKINATQLTVVEP